MQCLEVCLFTFRFKNTCHWLHISQNEQCSLFLMKSLFNKMCCLQLITHCPKMLFLLFLAQFVRLGQLGSRSPYRELDHEGVDDAADHRDEVERVPGVHEVALHFAGIGATRRISQRKSRCKIKKFTFCFIIFFHK